MAQFYLLVQFSHAITQLIVLHCHSLDSCKRSVFNSNSSNRSPFVQIQTQAFCEDGRTTRTMAAQWSVWLQRSTHPTTHTLSQSHQHTRTETLWKQGTCRVPNLQTKGLEFALRQRCVAATQTQLYPGEVFSPLEQGDWEGLSCN